MIFDEATLRKLNALTLVADRVRAGRLRGDRRSSKRGTSIEFADYRNYVPGDDLRRLDWNIYGRLDKPFIKLFEDEQDLAVYILLDGSGSMDWGEEDENKFTYARRLAAALGSISLSSGDPTYFEFFSAASPSNFGPARGTAQTLRYFRHLETLQAGGETDLDRAIANFALTRKRPGLVFLHTDLLDPAGCQAGLNQLVGRGSQVVLLHVLAPDELDPTLSGDLKLIDMEFGAAQEVSLDAAVLRAYRRQLEGWIAEWQAFCTSRGITYLQIDTANPWDRFVLREMRAEGIVR